MPALPGAPEHVTPEHAAPEHVVGEHAAPERVVGERHDLIPVALVDDRHVGAAAAPAPLPEQALPARSAPPCERTAR